MRRSQELNGVYFPTQPYLSVGRAPGPSYHVQQPQSTARDAERREVVAGQNCRCNGAGISSGKDRAGISLYLHELGMNRDRIFLKLEQQKLERLLFLVARVRLSGLSLSQVRFLGRARFLGRSPFWLPLR